MPAFLGQKSERLGGGGWRGNPDIPIPYIQLLYIPLLVIPIPDIPTKNRNIELVWCIYARYSNSRYLYRFLVILDIFKIKFVLYLYQFLLV